MDGVGSIGGQTSQGLRLDYLNLLVAQLQNQNPLEPMDNSEMTTQLAQISQLEQLEQANASFGAALAAAEQSYAASLIGREVLFVPDGQVVPVGGRVTGVELVGEDIRLTVEGETVPLADIQAIRE